MNNLEKYGGDDPLIDQQHGILKNRLDIKDPVELEMRESDALIKTYDYAALYYEDTHSFSIDDIKNLHQKFLGEIYDWAGEFRRVDISSPGIRWCHAPYIDSEMNKFEISLKQMTPFTPEMPIEEVINRLSFLHGELIVIHPFRDGNGRVTRLLGNLLLMQSGRKPLQQRSFYDESWRDEYFDCIQSVWQKADYPKLGVFLLKCLSE